MHNQSGRIILYSSLAIVLLVFMWGMRQIPTEGHLADQALRESLNQELIVLSGAVKASTTAMKYRLLDVLKAEGNEHVTRTFQDSPFIAATLLEWDQVQWKSLWYSVKSKTDFQSPELKNWLKDWPLSKLAVDEVYFTKIGDVQGQAYFAIMVPVRKPNQVPMVGVGIFPAAQFGLSFSSDENREVRVFTHQGVALALSHPAYLGASVKTEPLVREMLDGEEVSLRHEWRSERTGKMIGLAARIPEGNLFAAIETKAQSASTVQAWAYLLLCAIGAGIINWVLFSSVLRTLLAQISQSEGVNEQLRRQLSEKPATTVQLENESILTAPSLANMDFTEPAGDTPDLVNRVSGENIEPVPAGMTSLGKVMSSSLKALQSRLNELHIQVVQYGLENMDLTADALQLQTAIEEVLKNAIESMTGRPASKLTISARADRGFVHLVIDDNGCGIPENDVEKVFDPFFSTKDSEGVARGLGLNVVRRVVEELKGNVKLHSTIANGTRVEIELPQAGSVTVEAEPVVKLPETAYSEVTEIPEMSAAAAAMLSQHWPEFSIRKPKVRTLD